MNQLGGFPLLTLIVALPGLGALAAAFIPSRRKEAVRWLTFLIAAADLFIALFLYMGWSNDPNGELQFVDGPWTWVPTLGIQYYLGVDGINLHLVMLTVLLVPLLMLFNWSETSRSQEIGMLAFQAGMVGALTCCDLTLFVSFWLLTMLAVFFLLNAGSRGTEKTGPVSGGSHFFIIMVIGAILMLAVLSGLLVSRSSSSLSALLTIPPNWRVQTWLFWGMAIAMGLTGAIFPLHFAHADTYRHAPLPTQILLSGLLTNLAGYGLIRFCLLPFPLAATRFAPAMIVIGAMGTLYGGFAALGADSWAGTVGYWSLAQMGLTMIGIFSSQDLGIHGAIAHLIGRGLNVATLLILSGSGLSLKDRAARSLAFLSALGMPGLAGFVGQSILVVGIMRWHWQLNGPPILNTLLDWGLYGTVVLGLLVSAWAILRLWQQPVPRAGLASVASGQASRTLLITIPLLIALLVLGLCPYAFSDTVGPTVYRLLGTVEAGIQKSLLQMAQPPAEQPNGGTPLPTQTPSPEGPGSSQSHNSTSSLLSVWAYSSHL